MAVLPMIRVLGIRHLSPACARNAVRTIRQWKPDMVLLEAPEDMGAVFLRPAAFPALLVAYDPSPPRRPRRIPLADYSPEVAVLRLCRDEEIPWRCIDLPSALWEAPELRDDAQSAFARYALSREEADFDDAWEREFEHNDRGFWERTLAFGLELRDSLFTSENTRRREAHMLAALHKAIEEGFDRILCVCGAFHAPVLAGLREPEPPACPLMPPMPLPPSQICVLPLSEKALSTGAGCASGNRSPAYHRLLWENPATAAERFCTLLARELRRRGSAVSAADSQSALLLGRELAALRNGSLILRDLLDAAKLCFDVPGELFAAVAEELSVGTQIGQGDGDSPSPLCLDIAEELARHRLEEGVRRNNTLRLDRQKPTERARSHVLHRLRELDLGLCEPLNGADNGNRERWRLISQPAWASRALALEGDTLAEAAAIRIASCREEGAGEPLSLLSRLLCCGLPYSETLQRLCASLPEEKDAPRILRAALQLDLWARQDADTALRTAANRFFERAARLFAACLQSGVEQSRAAAPFLLSLGRIAGNDVCTDGVWRSLLSALLESGGTERFARGLCFSLWLERYEPDGSLASSCFDHAFAGLPTDSSLFREGLFMAGRLRVLRDGAFTDAFRQWLDGLSDSAFRRLRPALYAFFAGFTAEEKELLRGQATGAEASQVHPPSFDEAALEILRGLSLED